MLLIPTVKEDVGKQESSPHLVVRVGGVCDGRSGRGLGQNDGIGVKSPRAKREIAQDRWNIYAIYGKKRAGPLGHCPFGPDFENGGPDLAGVIRVDVRQINRGLTRRNRVVRIQHLHDRIARIGEGRGVRVRAARDSHRHGICNHGGRIVH